MSDFTGEGVLTGVGEPIYDQPFLTSTGTLTAVNTGTLAVTATAEFAGEGTLEVGGGDPVAYELQLAVLDDSLIQAPTAVVVFVTDAASGQDVVFTIDGVAAATATATVDGQVGPLSVPVSEALGSAGTHTVTATQAGYGSASATFTIANEPALAPIVRGPDAQAVDVPAAIVDGHRHWVLQDLTPGGLGSYVMQWNPRRMTAPHRERPLDARHTTAQTGQFHVHEGGPRPVEWQFSGFCTQTDHDKLLAYHALNRRFYVIDHRGRAWKVTFVDVDMNARRRVTFVDGSSTDWGHDYTVTALIYDQDWVTPA